MSGRFVVLHQFIILAVKYIKYHSNSFPLKDEPARLMQVLFKTKRHSDKHDQSLKCYDFQKEKQLTHL